MTFPDLQPYYELLELPAEAQAAHVDAAYLRLAQQRLRAGDKASLGALKQARAKLKAALLEQEHAAAASRPQTYAQADSGVGRLQRRLEDWGWEAQVGIKGRSLHVALQASQVPRPLLTGAKVYTLVAQQVGSEPDFRHLQHLHVYGLQAPRQPRWRRQMTMPAPSWTTADFDLFSCQNRISSVFIFPGLLLLGLLLSAWNLSRFLLRGITIWFHEFGHATIAWLSGRRALPLPLGWTNYEFDRSWFVYVGLLILFGLLFWAGRREQRPWPQVLAIALLSLQFLMTWLLSADMFEQLNAFGGIGGEFYLSTLLIVSFHFSLPAYWRWEVWRYPATLGAAFTFWGSFRQWRRIQAGWEDIPWGSLWGGPEHGDMNTLYYDFGWSDTQIISTYNHLASLCLLIMLALYLWRALWQHRHFLQNLWQQLLARLA